MKKKILKILFLLLFFCYSNFYSQSNYQLNYEYKYGVKIIVPSFHNIIMGMIDKNFVEVIETNGYVRKETMGSYYAATKDGEPQYAIDKEYGILSFSWFNDTDFNLKVKAQLDDMEKPAYLGKNQYRYRLKMKNNSVLNIKLTTDERSGLLLCYFE